MTQTEFIFIFNIKSSVFNKFIRSLINEVTSTQSVEPIEQQNNDPLGVNKQQVPYMEFLWKEKPFPDVTFIVQNEEVLAHRVILLKSRYFQNMFNSTEFAVAMLNNPLIRWNY